MQLKKYQEGNLQQYMFTLQVRKDLKILILSFYFQKLKKKQKKQVEERKQYIHSEIENKKINITKVDSLKKLNKINIPLVRLIKIKETQIITVRNEIYVTTDSAVFKE